MANRHLARTIVLQSLYQWDFNKQEGDLIDVFKSNLSDFAPDFDDGNFALNLIKGVEKNSEAINKSITTYAPQWPLDQITTVDRNVLRMGIYELQYDESIPPKVVPQQLIDWCLKVPTVRSGEIVLNPFIVL